MFVRTRKLTGWRILVAYLDLLEDESKLILNNLGSFFKHISMHPISHQISQSTSLQACHPPYHSIFHKPLTHPTNWPPIYPSLLTPLDPTWPHLTAHDPTWLHLTLLDPTWPPLTYPDCPLTCRAYFRKALHTHRSKFVRIVIFSCGSNSINTAVYLCIYLSICVSICPS